MSASKDNDIQEHLDKINKLARKQMDDTLSTIERDILLESLRTIYDAVYNQEPGQVKDKNTSSSGQSSPGKTPGENAEKEKASVNKGGNEPASAKKKDEKKEDPSKTRSSHVGKTESTTKTQEQEKPDDRPEPTQADKEPSLNEKFEQEQSELSDKLQEPVNELKSAIGVNERYAFLHELFNGNKSAYNGALKYLDNCKSFEQAKAFMEELSPKYNWEKSKDVRKELYELVKRKFQ